MDTGNPDADAGGPREDPEVDITRDELTFRRHSQDQDSSDMEIETAGPIRTPVEGETGDSKDGNEISCRDGDDKSGKSASQF